MVTMFNPKSLNDAYKYAKQTEQFQEGQLRRLRGNPIPQNLLTYPRHREGEDRRAIVLANNQNNNGYRNMTYDQKRALGLCTKCDAKWQPGHQCANRTIHLLMGPGDVVEEENEPVVIYEEGSSSGEADKIEEIVITLFAAKDAKRVKNMKFKGLVGQTPVCALIDSGSTYSYVNPDVLYSKPFVISKTDPMTVVVANGDKMLTDYECKGLKFSIQGNEFVKDVRLLDIKGYDLILGLDWLTERGPMMVDWKKGCLRFNNGSKEVMLKVGEEVAEVALCQSEMNLIQEGKNGNEVLIAQLFLVTSESAKEKHSVPKLQQVLEKYSKVFDKPKTLPPHRAIDHQILLTPDTKPINL